MAHKNKNEDPPPSYSSIDSSVKYETTPLLWKRSQPAQEQCTSDDCRRVALALLAFIGVALMVFGISFATFRNVTTELPRPRSVAIIGAGPAGIAAAFHLERLARGKSIPIEITIFERNAFIGGRLATLASVFPHNDHSFGQVEPEMIVGNHLLASSKTLSEWAKQIGVGPAFYDHVEQVGIFDGEHMVFQATRPSSAQSWSSWLGQLYHYGLSPGRSTNLAANTMKKLEQLSSPTLCLFQSLQGVVHKLGLVMETSSGGRNRLREAGISEIYEQEVILPETRKRISQDVAELSGLAVATAIFDGDQGVAKAGGQVLRILEEMAHRSKANLRLSTEVFGLRPNPLDTSKWILASRRTGSDRETAEPEYEEYGKVIFAAPYTPEEVEFRNVTTDSIPQVLPYRSCHITLWTSGQKIAAENFGMNPGQDLPRRILVTGHPKGEIADFGLQELALVKEMPRVSEDGGGVITEYLYRALSARKMEDDELWRDTQKSSSITWIYRAHLQQAYPRLFSQTSYPAIEVGRSLWYTSAVEAVGSSFELGVWAGRNVAGLVSAELVKENGGF